jgi:hypothetical protein
MTISRFLRGLKAFFYHILQHLLVQAQVSDQLFELGIFLLKLAKSPQFRDAQNTELLLPAEEGRLRNPHLPIDLLDTGAGFGLA